MRNGRGGGGAGDKSSLTPTKRGGTESFSHSEIGGGGAQKYMRYF